MTRYDGVQFSLCEACWSRRPNPSRPWNVTTIEARRIVRCARCKDRLEQYIEARKIQLRPPP